MPKLYVIPRDVHEYVLGSGNSYNLLTTSDGIAKLLSAADIASVQRAMSVFPFQFSPEAGIVFAPYPMTTLGSDELYTDLLARATRKFEALALNTDLEKTGTAREYVYYPVDESVWVAVEQRVHESSDPANTTLLINSDFFSALLNAVSNTLGINAAQRSNLLTYYLQSTPNGAQSTE